MIKDWFFSEDKNIGDDFSDHGTETFKNNNEGAEKFKKFAREMVQNAIDAKNEKIKDPLVVKFEMIEVERKDLPSFDSLREHINGTIEYCKLKNKLNNAYNNSKRELSLLNSNDKIRILKTSDYNTKGVTGSKNTFKGKSKWESMIYNDGDTDKDSQDSLGSHGVGKLSAFSMSGVRTVFYSTKDIDGNRAMEGVSRQYVSYVNGIKKFYKGYYGKIEDNLVKPFVDDEIDEFSDVFKREENGTDVFILEPDVSYLSDEFVKWYLIESVLCNFFVAIRDGLLEVVVNGVEVNQAKISQIFVALNSFYERNSLEKSDMLIATEQYMKALDSDNFISEDLKDYGEINLWLYKDSTIKWKNVAIVRKNGMFIKNCEVKYADQKFAGVVIVKGSEGVDFLRSIEDPNHLDFDPSRPTENYGTVEDKQKRLNLFYDWIKSHAKSFTKIISEDNFTLSGMEDYIQMPSDTEKKYDLKNMDPTVIKTKPKKQTKSRIAKKTNVINTEEGTTQVIPPDGGEGGTHIPNPYPKDHKEQVEDENSKVKGFVKSYVASYELGPVIKHNINESVLVFEVTETNKDFKIKLNAVDEDGKENGILPNAISAFNVNTGEVLECKRHIIYGVKCQGVMKIKIKFDSPIRCCIKPVVYWEE